MVDSNSKKTNTTWRCFDCAIDCDTPWHPVYYAQGTFLEELSQTFISFCPQCKNYQIKKEKSPPSQIETKQKIAELEFA
jgi:hypothetical protein